MGKEEIITLEEYESRKGCLDGCEAAAIIKLLCIALDKLHRNKITYRELCPANILLVCNNDEKEAITDINLAESKAPRQYHAGATEDTVLMGIERYAAPEQYGFAQSMPATDIFAVGIIFNEMLTGQVPEEEKANQPVCAYIIEKCCCLDWKKRYKNITALRKDIEWYLSHQECKKITWRIHQNRKLIATGITLFAVCVGLFLWVGFAMQNIHKSDTTDNTPALKAPVQGQKKEQKYQKYTVGGREMVVYYPEGFHYSGKTEKENIITIDFAPDTGDTGTLQIAVANNDLSYSLEECAEMLLPHLSETYPDGEMITKEVEDKQLELYYKFAANQKEYIIGTQIQYQQNNKIVVWALGIYDAEEDERYREYFDTMLEKIEY